MASTSTYTHVYTGDIATYGVTLAPSRPGHGRGTQAIKIAAHLTRTATLPIGTTVVVPGKRVTPYCALCESGDLNTHNHGNTP